MTNAAGRVTKPLAGAPTTASSPWILREEWPAILCAVAIFLLSHPFAGMIGDSKIYMGRALADADPEGVGRDIMFVLDGQSQFSLFGLLARAALANLSPSFSAQAIVALSQILLVAALVVFCRRLAGRRFLGIAILAAVLPAAYGPPGLLHFAEPLAEPRPLAEAFVLFGLVAWLTNRRLVSAALLVVAAAIHPLMALAGFATIGFILMTEHAGWRLIAGATALAFVGAAAFGFPFARRLLELADAQWLELLRSRSPLLFPDAWIANAAPLMGVQGMTLLAAATRSASQLRLMFLAVLATGVGGIALAWIAGLYWPSVLLLQLQVWRTWWLVAALSPIAFGYLAVNIGRRPPQEQIALAVLTLAWAETGLGATAPILAAAALLLQCGKTLPSVTFTPRHVIWAWLGVAASILGVWIGDLPEMKAYILDWPADYRPRLAHLAFAIVQQPLIVACAALGFLEDRLMAMHYLRRACIAAALVFAAIFFWNDAASFDRAVARGDFQETLASAEVSHGGDILWISASNEPWLWLRQPNWAARIQGAGIVFSRHLSERYAQRAKILRDLDIDDLFAPQIPDGRPFPPRPSGEAFNRLCARTDAPASIVVPVDARMTVPDDWKARKVWRAPASRVEYPDGDIAHAVSVRDYAVISCADHR